MHITSIHRLKGPQNLFLSVHEEEMGGRGSKEICDRSQLGLEVYDACRAREGVAHTKSDFVEPKSLVDHLRPGDLIQVKGNYVHQWFYSHFAVFVGNGEVAHVTKVSSNYICIKREKMVDAFSGKLVRKNNHLDNVTHFQAKSPREIVITAREWVGKRWAYNFFTNNCEHFATLCRYGRAVSLQSSGIGDIIAGKIGWGEFVEHSIRSIAEKCDTFTSWVNRKPLGFVEDVKCLLSISWLREDDDLMYNDCRFHVYS